MAIGSAFAYDGRAAGRDPRPRGGDGPTEDGRPLAGRGARRHRGPGGLGRGRRRPTAWARPHPSWPRTSCYEGVHLTGGGAMLPGHGQRAWPTPPRCRCTWSTRRSSAWCTAPGSCLESFDRLQRHLRRGRAERAAGSGASGPVGRRAPRRGGPRPPDGPASRGPRGSAERGLDRGVVETGQGHRGPPPHGRLVVERVEDGGEPGRVADGAEGGHRRLAAARVRVGGAPSPPARTPQRGGGVHPGTRLRPRRRVGRGRPEPR